MSPTSASTTAVPTRDRIVEVALRLFSERGTTAVSMRELADAAGVTVPGLYYHFDSKAELIREVFRARFTRPEAPVEDPEPAPAERLIVEQARRSFHRLVEDREFLRLMQREAVLGDEDALAVQGTLAAEWRQRWADVLAKATDLDPTVDRDAAADVIATFLWGLFVEHLLRSDPADIDRIDAFARTVAPALTKGATR
ncbi:MAG: helix-turn-helix domain-containing protein [Acidimicrobiia bacterium]